MRKGLQLDTTNGKCAQHYTVTIERAGLLIMQFVPIGQALCFKVCSVIAILRSAICQEITDLRTSKIRN